MVGAKRKGHAEGMAEGRDEERRRLLEMLNLGLSVEEIKQRLEPNNR
jgi:predicted transposase YdaD